MRSSARGSGTDGNLRVEKLGSYGQRERERNRVLNLLVE